MLQSKIYNTFSKLAHFRYILIHKIQELQSVNKSCLLCKVTSSSTARNSSKPSKLNLLLRDKTISANKNYEQLNTLTAQSITLLHATKTRKDIMESNTIIHSNFTLCLRVTRCLRSSSYRSSSLSSIMQSEVHWHFCNLEP